MLFRLPARQVWLVPLQKEEKDFTVDWQRGQEEGRPRSQGALDWTFLWASSRAAWAGAGYMGLGFRKRSFGADVLIPVSPGVLQARLRAPREAGTAASSARPLPKPALPMITSYSKSYSKC